MISVRTGLRHLQILSDAVCTIAAEIFVVGGGGGEPKKGPPHGEKSSKKAPTW